ncbi:Uncharacterised protein [Escherichia coli]|uniref:Uncharacterized protein n=1 Tax=Escherichia phage vB_Eco_slurp01 TaxID=1874688 RepID=A0A1C3S677_9CAUD|nr:hypothetical protein G17_00161 [Escherichia phage vB_EcoM_G17]WNN14485.1 hypothetical protein Sharanji_gp197 [Escherichia phage Sharanji]SCA80037.1 hypothetical protein PSLUR01_00060 [Escherichia phage vB_Eco_slurp01]VVZ30662.1 Uncharacterised protein [Escherichia coli]VVZ34953.1 Uncharacterised protein [Escherichia coli]
MSVLSLNSYQMIQELHEKHDIIVDVEKKEVVMKKQAYRILEDFHLKAFIMKFCTDEHLTGRVIRKEL